MCLTQDLEGWWFKPQSSHNMISAAVGPLRALQGDWLLAAHSLKTTRSCTPLFYCMNRPHSLVSGQCWLWPAALESNTKLALARALIGWLQLACSICIISSLTSNVDGQLGNTQVWLVSNTQSVFLQPNQTGNLNCYKNGGWHTRPCLCSPKLFTAMVSRPGSNTVCNRFGFKYSSVLILVIT